MGKKYGGLDLNKKRRKKINITDFGNILSWIFDIGLVIAMAYVLVSFFGVRTTAIGQAMEPTIGNGDQIFVDEFRYLALDPKKDDIIVFLPNGNEKSHYYVRRVVGVPGDMIQIQEGYLYVNGERQDSDTAMDYAGIADQEIILGDDEYFVLGDNRNDSEDSRYANIGTVEKSYIIGKAWFRFVSIGNMGFIH